MHVNNEIGVIQPIAEMGEILRRRASSSTWTLRNPPARRRSTCRRSRWT
jgi:hypothetical protein